MLGMAVALTSCSDDDDYTPAGQKAGVYFPNTQATEFNILPDETSFDIAVARTTGGPSTVTVTAVDESGLFTIPTSVSFDDDKNDTKLTIAYDPAKFTLGETYTFTLSLSDGANVAETTKTFALTFAENLVTEPFEEGSGVFYYSQWWNGYAPSDITMTYSPAAPNKVTFTIKEFGAYGTPDFIVECEDITAVDADGNVVVNVPTYNPGIDNNGPVLLEDVRSWLTRIGLGSLAANYAPSYYNVETGTFSFDLVYFPEAGDSPSSYYMMGVETFQMDGYPVYGLEVEYNGMVTDRDGNMTANCTVYPEADVASVKVVLVAGKDPNAGVAAILNGAEGVQEFGYADEISVTFPVSEGGMFSVVAVSYDKDGEAQEAAYDTFELFIGANPNADWNDLGLCDYRDGWVIPAFTYKDGTSVDNEEYIYPVPIQIHKTEPNVYRLVEPYGDDFPFASNNAFPAKRNIQFAIIDDLPLFAPQACGFGPKNWGGELTVGNMEGYYYYDEGFDIATIKAGLKAEFLSYIEEGVITLPLPVFEDFETGEFGFNWENYQPGQIFMPDMDQVAKRRVKSANVAKPVIKGASKAVKANVVRMLRDVKTDKFAPFRGLYGAK